MSTGSTPGHPRKPKQASSLVGLIVTPELSNGLRRAWSPCARRCGDRGGDRAARRCAPESELRRPLCGGRRGAFALAIGTARGTRWALRVSLVLLGLQLLGTIGSAWQLTHAAADEKAAELKRLGVDPTFGLTLNLMYSAIAFPGGRRAGELCSWRVIAPARCISRTPLFMHHAASRAPTEGAAAARPLRATSERHATVAADARIGREPGVSLASGRLPHRRGEARAGPRGLAARGDARALIGQRALCPAV